MIEPCINLFEKGLGHTENYANMAPDFSLPSFILQLEEIFNDPPIFKNSGINEIFLKLSKSDETEITSFSLG